MFSFVVQYESIAPHILYPIDDGQRSVYDKSKGHDKITKTSVWFHSHEPTQQSQLGYNIYRRFCQSIAGLVVNCDHMFVHKWSITSIVMDFPLVFDSFTQLISFSVSVYRRTIGVYVCDMNEIILF